MRSLFIAAFFALGLIATPVFAQDADDVGKDDVIKEVKEKAVNANVYEATMAGMTWVTWPAQVEKTIKRLDGVDSVSVDGKTMVATITMKDGKTLEKATLDKTFEGTRFSVTKFKQTQEAEKKDDAEEAEFSSFHATIAGMTWGVGCVRAVKKIVSSLEGVDSVEVNYDAKVATIKMKDGKQLDKQTLDKAFKDSRYSCTKFEGVEEKSEETEKEKSKEG